MENKQRIYIYAFLSRIFSDVPDRKLVSDLKDNPGMLELLGQTSVTWFASNDVETLYDAMNIDYTSLFLMNSQPIESVVLEEKEEVLVGLANPVMSFYVNSGYDLYLNRTRLQTPDHISIEFGFMQNLVQKEETKLQKKFLDEHLLNWIPPYLWGLKKSAITPFFKELCDFTAEFLMADYEGLV